MSFLSADHSRAMPSELPTFQNGGAHVSDEIEDLQAIFFSDKSEECERIEFKILKRWNKPLLFFPKQTQLANDVLSLYPAQSFFGRSTKRLLSACAKFGIPLPLQPLDIKVTHDRGFAQFLCELEGVGNSLPEFAILAGNPKVKGRRYIVLTFTNTGKASHAVKVGLGPDAKALVAKEAEFLSAMVGKRVGIPELKGRFSSDSIEAFALDFFSGEMDEILSRELGEMLERWIDQRMLMSLEGLPDWRKLDEACASRPSWAALTQTARTRVVRPVVSHGDLAPWNVRTSTLDGSPVFLDWEHGELLGVPCWDWFHYVVQSSVLIHHHSAKDTMNELEELITSDAFEDYARETRVDGIEFILLLGYLVHAVVLQPQTEGTAEIRELLTIVQDRLSHGGILKQLSSEQRAFPPTFSIVTPSYRQFEWLKLCAASVADQTGVKFEHIIQDAGTGPKAEDWIKQNTSARLFVEKDAGMYDAINRGFKRARGDILAWLNCDEQYLPGALRKVARFFEKNPDIEVLFGDALLLDENGNMLSYRRTVLPSLLHTRLSHLATLSCATFVRRSVIERGLLLDPKWKAIADAVWVADLIHEGAKMAVLRKPLATFTITQSNLGQTSIAMAETEKWQSTLPRWIKWMTPVVIIIHRLRKIFAGAYFLRQVEANVYTQNSPKRRVPKSSSGVAFLWPSAGETGSGSKLRDLARTGLTLATGRSSAAFGSQGRDRRLSAGSIFLTILVAATVCALVLWIDKNTGNVVITPFVSVSMLLALSFFLPPLSIAITALIFGLGIYISLRYVNTFSPDTPGAMVNLILRMAGFCLTSTFATLFSRDRIRSKNLMAQTFDVLSHVPAPMVISDASGHVKFANSEAVDVLGISHDELMETPFLKLFMSDQDEGSAAREYREIIESPRGGAKERDVVVSSRQYLKCHARMVPIGDRNARLLVTLIHPQIFQTTAPSSDSPKSAAY